jgi:hypothetical protein
VGLVTKLHERDDVTVGYADHPKRSDSPEYGRSRRWLMDTSGGCYVCGGPVDLSHPEAPADARGLEDHHGGGLHRIAADGTASLVALGLAPLEWAGGWAADPKRVEAFAITQRAVMSAISEGTVSELPAITDTQGVMAYVDSVFNASVKLCQAHHVGVPDAHTPDGNGHEAVGIHHCPVPIWALQATCEWARFDMWGGSTGTVAVAPDPDVAGATRVLHVHHAHPVKLVVGEQLPPTHPHSRAAHMGFGR